MEKKLPTIVFRRKEWTVDERLQEFRFMVLGRMPEFVPFDSEEGLQLLMAYWSRSQLQSEM